MAMFLGTALFLVTIVVALWAIAATVMGSLPRIAEVLGELVPEPKSRATLVSARVAVRS